MKIQLTSKFMLDAINNKIWDNKHPNKYNLAAYITNGYYINEYYDAKLAKLANIKDDEQLYLAAKIVNSKASMYEDVNKLISDVAKLIAYELNIEQNSIEISEKDFVGKSSTSTMTYFFFKLDKVEVR